MDLSELTNKERAEATQLMVSIGHLRHAVRQGQSEIDCLRVLSFVKSMSVLSCRPITGLVFYGQ